MEKASGIANFVAPRVIFPSGQNTCRLQAVAAAAILWKVELATSYVSTRGVPSTTFARILVTSA
jgi:hypothetical protein